jgi:hypothetical protein
MMVLFAVRGRSPQTLPSDYGPPPYFSRQFLGKQRE